MGMEIPRAEGLSPMDSAPGVSLRNLSRPKVAAALRLKEISWQFGKPTGGVSRSGDPFWFPTET